MPLFLWAFPLSGELVRQNWSEKNWSGKACPFRPELLTQSEAVALALWASRNHLKVFTQVIPNMPSQIE